MLPADPGKRVVNSKVCIVGNSFLDGCCCSTNLPVLVVVGTTETCVCRGILARQSPSSFEGVRAE